MYLDSLVKVSEIENISFETKARLDRTNIEGWLKTVGGFSNAVGGSFFIGVENGTEKLIGFDRVSADAERNYFTSIVNEHVFPRPNMKISFIKYENRGKELFVIRIDIKESAIKPVIVKFHEVPSIYMRRDGFTNGATYEEIFDMARRSSRTQYDVEESDYGFNRDDFKGLFAFYARHNDDRKLTDKALASMGFFNSSRSLSNGALLFSDNKYDKSKTRVNCSVFAGFTRGSNRIVTINRFENNLTDSIDNIMDFVSQRMNHSMIKRPDGRQNIDAYPKRALFEAVVNAIAHRNYHLDGTQIQVDMFKDRLEIISPGGFFQGGDIKKTYNLSNIISKRRNELICNVLVACNVMEAAGTGFDKIMEEYSDVDEAHKPYVVSSSDQFTIVLPDITYSEGVTGADSELDLSFVPAKNASVHDAKILAFCYEHARKANEIAAKIKVSDSSWFRSNILENLVEQGYLEKYKAGASYWYKTNREEVFVQE